MRYKHLLFLLIVTGTFASCSSGNRKFTIVGNIDNMPEQTVVLEQLNANDIITIVDSERSDKKGHFELAGISPEPGLYRLHFHQNKYILLSIDKGNIKVSANWLSIENYNVFGSPESENLKTFIVGIREHLRDFNTMTAVLDTLEAKGNDSVLQVAKKDFQDIRNNFTAFVKAYADTDRYEPNAIFAVRMLNPTTEMNFLEAFPKSLSRRFPASTKMTRDYDEYYTRVKQKVIPAKPTVASTEVGVNAPEFNLPTPDGKSVALSSLKGQYVLVDFWASWCGPCRGENPNVVAAYAKFKDKNFTIIGVSLDNKKDAWEKAIKDDNLSWTQVSDLKGWSSAAAVLYGVQSIPTNYLLDPTGKIIARNLRGSALTDFLTGVLK